MKNDDENGTLVPPLVLFGRYGGGSHHHAPRDDSHRFEVAHEVRRAKKVRISPSYLGYAGGGQKEYISLDKEQQIKWLELSKK